MGVIRSIQLELTNRPATVAFFQYSSNMTVITFYVRKIPTKIVAKRLIGIARKNNLVNNVRALQKNIVHNPYIF